MLDSSPQHGREVAGFSVEVHPHRDRVVVVPSGEIDLSTVDAVGQELGELRLAGFDDIAVDLRGVTFIDSSGLHLLLTESQKAERDGYRFRLAGVSPAAVRLFELTGTRDAFSFTDGGAPAT